MALDFSTYVSGDPPELKAFKKQVVEVAKNHSATFHCGEYRSVLRQLGIRESSDFLPVEVTCKTSEDWEFTVEVDPDEMITLDEEAQLEKIVEIFAGKVKEMAGFSIKIPSSSITSAEITKGRKREISDEIGVWRYATDHGRASHFFHGVTDDDADNFRVRGTSALCGQYSSYPRQYTERSSGSPEEPRNRCQRCTDALVSLTAEGGG